MFKYYVSGAYKSVYDDLVKHDILTEDASSMRNYKLLEYVQTVLTTDPKTLKTCLEVIEDAKPSPIILTKTFMLLHTFLQSSKASKDSIFQPMIRFCKNAMVRIARQRDEIIKRQRSKSVTISKGHVEDTPCRQTFLIDSILKPYNNFLLKLMSCYDIYAELAAKPLKSLANHQIWVLINVVRLGYGVSERFTSVGRYFMKEYGGIVICLSELLMKDIRRIYPKIAELIRRSSGLLSSGNLSHSMVCESINLLEEINILNEKVNLICAGKYFFKYVNHILKPCLIDPSATEFDKLYSIWRQLKQKKRAQSVSSKLEQQERDALPNEGACFTFRPSSNSVQLQKTPTKTVESVKTAKNIERASLASPKVKVVPMGLAKKEPLRLKLSNN